MSFEHPDREQIDLSAVLHALSDPQRRGIVAELARSEEPRPCGSFAPEITKSTRTHHFRVLREAGLVEQWKEGTSKMSRLPPRGHRRPLPRPARLGAQLRGTRAGLTPPAPAGRC